MNPETELKLQAWVDGELPAAEAARLAAQAANDPALQALARQLRAVKAALPGNELARSVPETREFYWGTIQRALERAEVTDTVRPVWRWRAWLGAYGWRTALGAALLLVLAAPVLRQRHPAALAPQVQVDSPLENVNSYTFRSEADGMTVMWVSSQ